MEKTRARGRERGLVTKTQWIHRETERGGGEVRGAGEGKRNKD